MRVRSTSTLRAGDCPQKSIFGKAEDLARCDSSLVPKWATNPNYEKNNLHFGQCRAPRSMRTKNRRCRTGIFACAGEESRKQHDCRESSNDHYQRVEGEGNHQHGRDSSEFVELHHHDDDDFKSEPVVLTGFSIRKSSRGLSPGRLLLYGRASHPGGRGADCRCVMMCSPCRRRIAPINPSRRRSD